MYVREVDIYLSMIVYIPVYAYVLELSHIYTFVYACKRTHVVKSINLMILMLISIKVTHLHV